MSSRFLGYVVSSLFAFLFYVACIFCELSLSRHVAHEQFVVALGALIWFALFGGFGVVFLALILPWAVAVSVRKQARWSGSLYFTFAGAMLVFVLGCVISSLMPKPLFIEDQTFFGGVMIAVKRQGICFALSGSVFGASYWFVSERYAWASKMLNSAPPG
jgi:hypothetical protein